MLELKKTPEHTIDRVFLLALLALFAATAFLVVSIGAKQYHSIADSMTANYETRTVSSYLEEKMNQNDVAGSVAVTSIGAFPAIALSETVTTDISARSQFPMEQLFYREMGRKSLKPRHLPLIWSAQIFTALPLRIRPDTPIRFISH